ncbi:hypothetical protein [Mycobacteroides franklinii]|uniref:hypothetical protein n=1 Tax=Mycobacteroides franklinii TaxID=948102 RepID=UPI000D6A0CEC|nr:hypothetical protein [Mycobacteroides franklinii]
MSVQASLWLRHSLASSKLGNEGAVAGVAVSRMHKLAHQLGVTPWEDAGAQSELREHLSAILDRESPVQIEMPQALDIGCGTGDHSVEMAARG